jgi:hypothetical protein
MIPSDHNLAPDLLASTLLLLVPHPSPVTEVTYHNVTRQANLALVGSTITGSIWRVLRGAARALKVARIRMLAQWIVRACVLFANSCRTGHIPPLKARPIPHRGVVSVCGGRYEHRDICGAACLRRDTWVCVRFELPRERWLRGQAQEM